MSRVISYLSPRRDRRGQLSRHRGFTLIESMMTTVIVGVAITSMLQFLAAGTVCNVDAAQLTTAVNLARNVREYTLKLGYADVVALNGTTYSAPIDSRGEEVSGFEGWSQRIIVQPVRFDQLTRSAPDASSEALYVTVEVAYGGVPVGEAQWYRFRPGWW